MQLHRAALIGLALLVPAVAAAQAPGKVTLADLKVLEGTWILDVEKSGLTQAEAERRVMSSGPAWLRTEASTWTLSAPVLTRVSGVLIAGGCGK